MHFLSSGIKNHSYLHYRYNPLEGSNIDLTPLTLLFSKSKSNKQSGHFEKNRQYYNIYKIWYKFKITMK